MPEVREILSSAFNSDLASKVEQATSSQTTAVVPVTQETKVVDPAPQQTQTAERQPEKVVAPDDTAKSQVQNKPDAESEKQSETVQHTPEDRAERAIKARVDRAPAQWRPAAKAQWASIPLEARQDIHRREQNLQDVLKQAANLRNSVSEIMAAVEPYAQRMNQLGVTPPQALSRLLYADHLLNTAPPQQRAAAMAKMITEYSIDIEQLDSELHKIVGDVNQYNQRNAVAQATRQAVANELAPLRQQQVQQEQQQMAAAANNLIEEMSLDPRFPHLSIVGADMSDLIELKTRRGQQISLADAYAQAVQLHPELSSSHSPNTQALQSQQSAQSSQANATRAAEAAVSVSGGPSAVSKNVNPSDLRSVLANAFADTAGRV